MGMIGYYFRADEEMLRKIRKGDTMAVVFNEKYQDNLLDIDKSWNVIHVILNGSTYTKKKKNICSKLVFNKKLVNRDDLGYGPAALLEQEEVVQMAEELQKWDEEKFRENFHIKEMVEKNVYPLMSDQVGEEYEKEFFQYVWAYFVELQEFFKEAAAKGQSVVSFIF